MTNSVSPLRAEQGIGVIERQSSLELGSRLDTREARAVGLGALPGTGEGGGLVSPALWVELRSGRARAAAGNWCWAGGLWAEPSGGEQISFLTEVCLSLVEATVSLLSRRQISGKQVTISP